MWNVNCQGCGREISLTDAQMKARVELRDFYILCNICIAFPQLEEPDPNEALAMQVGKGLHDISSEHTV
jgi:hypothetical protein